jgi:hypothetical protein
MLSVNLSDPIGTFYPNMNGSDTSWALVQKTQQLICTPYQAEYKLKSIYANGVSALSYSAKATIPLDFSIDTFFFFSLTFGDDPESWNGSEITTHQRANTYALVDSMVSAISGNCSKIGLFEGSTSRFTLPNGTEISLFGLEVLETCYTGQY